MKLTSKFNRNKKKIDIQTIVTTIKVWEIATDQMIGIQIIIALVVVQEEEVVDIDQAMIVTLACFRHRAVNHRVDIRRAIPWTIAWVVMVDIIQKIDIPIIDIQIVGPTTGTQRAMDDIIQQRWLAHVIQHQIIASQLATIAIQYSYWNTATEEIDMAAAAVAAVVVVAVQVKSKPYHLNF